MLGGADGPAWRNSVEQLQILFEKVSNLVVQSSPNKTCAVWGEFLANGAKRRERKRRVFLDFFVVKSEVRSEDFLERGVSTQHIWNEQVAKV